MIEPFAQFHVIPDVFAVDECEALIEHADWLEFGEAEGSWPWIAQAKTLDPGPAWASDRFVELVDALNVTFWHGGPLLMYPAFVYLRLGAGDWIPPHVDHHDDGWDEVMAMSYLADPDTYDGGEILVQGQRDPVKPERGCVVVMPRGRLHAVAPVRSGTRWTMQRLFYRPPSDHVPGSTNLIPAERIAA